MRGRGLRAPSVWALATCLWLRPAPRPREAGRAALLPSGAPLAGRSPHRPALPRGASAPSRRGRAGAPARRSASESAAVLTELPGPWALPFLGAPRVLWALLTQRPLPELLAELRAEYGPLFALRAGPTCQVWVGDVAVLRRVYELPECSGRPVSFEDPFGNFLFLTREPEKAAPIRERQKAWIEANLRAETVRKAVVASLADLWPLLDGERAQPWPAAAVKTAMYSAVTGALLGSGGLLSGPELEQFMAATKEYSEMRVKGKFGQGGGGDLGLPPGAAKIREVLGAALARAGREDAEDALPLIVAATIGGAEIFPTLLHWIALQLAREPQTQEAAARAADERDAEALMRHLYAVLRRTAYSVALGPPRKILADAVVDGFRLPEGSLLFAMHPAVADRALGREPPAEEDFGEYAFGVGPRACLGRPLAEALLPAAMGEILRRYHLEVEPGDGGAALRGELRGQLIHPLDPPRLRWRRRAAS